MNSWVLVAAVAAMVVAVVVGVAETHRRRLSAGYYRRRALARALVAATNYSEALHQGDPACRAMLARGWTPDDATALGEMLASGVRLPNRPVGNLCIDAGYVLEALAEPDFLPGSTVATQMAWIRLVALNSGSEVLSALSSRGRTAWCAVGRGRKRGTPNPMTLWQQALGDFAPYAIAAGLTFDEAGSAAARGELDVEVLTMMAALRGVVMAAPATSSTMTVREAVLA